MLTEIVNITSFYIPVAYSWPKPMRQRSWECSLYDSNVNMVKLQVPLRNYP